MKEAVSFSSDFFLSWKVCSLDYSCLLETALREMQLKHKGVIEEEVPSSFVQSLSKGESDTGLHDLGQTCTDQNLGCSGTGLKQILVYKDQFIFQKFISKRANFFLMQQSSCHIGCQRGGKFNRHLKLQIALAPCRSLSCKIVK